MKLSTKIYTAAALLSLPASSLAGEPMTTPPTEPEAVGSAVSGVISLDVNTHFISYGADIWGAGNDWADALFNPLVEISFALNDNLTLSFGTWWDVNDNASSNIGDSIQEIDVWAGLALTTGKLTTSLVYQEWLYADESERIVDLIFALDAPLSPSLTLHGRVDEGASGGDTGVVAVAGIEIPLIDSDHFSLGIPVNVAAATDGFHGGDGGFAYASAGLGASVPLSFISSDLGEWALNAGVTYYYTDSDVIPNNPDESFVTGSLGVSVSF